MRSIAFVLLLIASCPSLGQQALTSHARSAHFRIGTEAVTPTVEPFTATVGVFGNSLIWSGGAFEPIVFRNRYTALEDSPARVAIAPEALSKYDSLREGFLDDAEVRIYRIEQGKFQLVRRDRVAAGGSRMSGWVRILKDRQLAGTTSFAYRWADWNRPGVPYYFAVRAVDKQGRSSLHSNAVEVLWKGGKSGSEPANALTSAPAKPSADPAPLSAPRNLRFSFSDEGTVQLAWDPVKSGELAGYEVYRSDSPPAQHKGHFLQLKQEGNPKPIKTGDMVIVSKTLYSASRSQMLSNRVWGANAEFRQILPGLVRYFPDEDPAKSWELARHEAATAVEQPGETYLKLTLAVGAGETLSVPNHSGSGQSRYEVLQNKPYHVEAWLRQEGPGTVKFTASGFYGGPNAIQPIVFSPGPSWKKFTATFTPPAEYAGSRNGHMALEFTGPGVFSVDNFRVYRADAGYLDFLPEEAQAVRSSRMQALRMHGTVKTGTRTYDMAQFTNSGGVIDAIRQGNTLPQMLAAVHKTGARPWLQVEYHMAPEEWLGLVEYLAAPYSPGRDTAKTKPWAHKRHAQGHPAPWIDDFDKIYLEFGNETWNRLFRPWIFEPMRDGATGREYTAGEVYGLYQEHVISILKSSPYWKSSGLDAKTAFVLGGWSTKRQYGQDAAAASPASDFLTIGAYIGGWDEAEGPPKLNPKSLFYVLNQVSQAGIPSADELVSAAREAASPRKRAVSLGTYEAGPGYALNGLNNAKVTDEQSREQELVMKSLAAGTATLDAFLARSLRGFQLQNFFTFGPGTLWKSHAPWYRGGKAYPSWELLSLFNNQAAGQMLRVETLSTPAADLEGFGRRKPARNAPLVAVYATRSKERYSIFVVSRKVAGFPIQDDQGFTPVTLELPFEQPGSVTLFRLAGSPEASDLRGDAIKMEQFKVPTARASGRRFILDAGTGADARGMPPGAAFLYVFDGVKSQ